MAETIVSTTNSQSVAEQPTPDAEFYFKVIVFQVGNTIFRVPKHGFEVPETIFNSMFTLPINENNLQDIEGSRDENPIVLHVNEAYFRGFLRVMYPFSGRSTTTDEDYLGALDLSTMWMFDEIRIKAIHALNVSGWVGKHSAKELALLAKKYHVVSWLKTAYTRLLQQGPLKTAELRAHPEFDWETIARLCCAKQSSTVNPASNSCTHCDDCIGICRCSSSLQANVDFEFRAEIKDMERASQGPLRR